MRGKITLVWNLINKEEETGEVEDPEILWEKKLCYFFLINLFLSVLGLSLLHMGFL